MRVVLALLCAALTISVAVPADAAALADGAAAAARRAAALAGARAEGGERALADGSSGRREASVQALSAVSVGDASGDDDYGDARADVIAASVDYRRGDVLRLAVKTRQLESLSAPRWVDGATSASWFVDTDGDGEDEYFVNAEVWDGRPTATVLRVADAQIACTGHFTASAAAGYVADLPASCVGDPSRVRFWGALAYDLHPSDPDAPLSLDFAPEEGWSSEVSRGARPFRHAKPAARRGTRFYLRDDLGRGPTDVRVDYGYASDVPLLCDWDGDGVRTLGAFRAGRWYLRNANAAGASQSFTWGLAGDVPVCGDWDGDGRDTPGVYRRGHWYLRERLTGGVTHRAAYGLPGDRPVVGDWDGDGRDTVAAVRGSTWYLRGTGGTTDARFDYGLPSDTPIVGDWDGDGRDTPGVYRDGLWLVRNTLASGRVAWMWEYGLPGDTPLVWR